MQGLPPTGCDVVIALHACGSATDDALRQAVAQGAAFVVPCEERAWCSLLWEERMAWLDRVTAPSTHTIGYTHLGTPTPTD